MDDTSEEESQDDIATMIPVGRKAANAAQDALARQRGGLETIGHYIAATLDSELRGPEVIIEGECVAVVRVHDRRTGVEIGTKTVTVPIAFAAEHCR